MRDRIIAKGIPAERIAVLPPWSHDSEVRFDPGGRERFREEHGLTGKFVVMYSGNHSPCHPLDTLLGAAARLADDPNIVFCFIGGGSEFKKVQRLAAGRPPDQTKAGRPFTRSTAEGKFSNILCLPYQPLSQLAGSLSAADLHVVVMGDSFVGLVHPCKIYNILSVSAPVLYVGPNPSHLTEILGAVNGQLFCASSPHGHPERLVEHICTARQTTSPHSREAPPAICASFSKGVLLPKLIAELERVML
jgi:glycosyltransferase involved in cell wall biosynthesis